MVSTRVLPTLVLPLLVGCTKPDRAPHPAPPPSACASTSAAGSATASALAPASASASASAKPLSRCETRCAQYASCRVPSFWSPSECLKYCREGKWETTFACLDRASSPCNRERIETCTDPCH